MQNHWLNQRQEKRWNAAINAVNELTDREKSELATAIRRYLRHVSLQEVPNDCDDEAGG
jgi:transposase